MTPLRMKLRGVKLGENNLKIHIMGILGSGASAAAGIAREYGYQVSGCDLDQSSPFQSGLVGIPVENTHSPAHLDKVDLLVISPAITSLDKSNPELVAAHEKGIKVLTWQTFVGEYLMKDKQVVAVTGTHGKTTTTTMIALILEKAGLDPTVILGAAVREWGRNYRVGQGNVFVIEADEFGDNFLNYHPDMAVVTNIEMDHPEYFQDFNHYFSSFKKFVDGMKDKSTLFTTDTVALINHRGETVKITPQKFNLQILGAFNQTNATFAYLVALQLGVDSNLAKETLRSFPGAGRRLELIGEVGGVKVYDDYGHHPTEILKTTQALREKYPKAEIWLVFQPHMYTRTKYLFTDFVNALRNSPVDQVILTEIWQSREQNDYSVNSQQLVAAVAKSSVRKIAKYTDIASYIVAHKKDEAIVVFMGAGDIYQASQILLEKLKELS